MTNLELVIRAALDDIGLAYMPEPNTAPRAIATVYGGWQKQQRFLNTRRQIREQQNVT